MFCVDSLDKIAFDPIFHFFYKISKFHTDKMMPRLLTLTNIHLCTSPSTRIPLASRINPNLLFVFFSEQTALLGGDHHHHNNNGGAGTKSHHHTSHSTHGTPAHGPSHHLQPPSSSSASNGAGGSQQPPRGLSRQMSTDSMSSLNSMSSACSVTSQHSTDTDTNGGKSGKENWVFFLRIVNFCFKRAPKSGSFCFLEAII